MKKLVSLFGKETSLNVLLNNKAKEYAEEKGIEYVWSPMNPFTEEAAVEALKDADAGLIDVETYDKSIFSKIHEKTKLLIRFGVGFDAVNLQDAAEYGIKVARTQGANATGVAEYALLLIMALRRKLLSGNRGVREGDWTKEIGNETVGSTVGILGFGAVGKTFAKLLQGFGCRVLAYDTWQDQKAAEELGVEFVDAETVFRESDAITVHLAFNDDTHFFVNKERLSLMKPGSVIVNTSRGPVIDEQALTEALQSGRLGGAGLDVFIEEPLSLKSELIKLDNVILSPHVASSTFESLWNIYKMAIDITDDFYNNKKSENINKCYLN